MRSHHHGITIVELLIAVAILGIVLSLLSTYFISQTRTSSRIQAANEVEIKVRTTAEIMTQDLQMAGSRIVVDRSGAAPVTKYVNDLLTECSPLKGTTTYCVKSSAASPLLTLYYATSLRQDDSATPVDERCRRVDYDLDGDTLRRSEVVCGNDPTFQEFSTRISNLNISFLCEDNTTSTDPAGCYAAADNFPQQATVAVTGLSDNVRENRETTVTLSTTMPNLRPVAVSE